jgi:hypothetical protein
MESGGDGSRCHAHHSSNFVLSKVEKIVKDDGSSLAKGEPR